MDDTICVFEASVILGVNVGTLQEWCKLGRGPKHVRRAPEGRGGRAAYRFKEDDITEFKAAREMARCAQLLEMEKARLERRVAINRKYYEQHKEKWRELNDRRRKEGGGDGRQI